MACLIDRRFVGSVLKRDPPPTIIVGVPAPAIGIAQQTQVQCVFDVPVLPSKEAEVRVVFVARKRRGQNRYLAGHRISLPGYG
jgi:hypothetical protein